MDILELLLGGGVPQVFEIGILPEDKDFLELTPEQYESYYRKNGQTEDEGKIYALLPQDPQKQGFDDFDGLCICSESEKIMLLRGVQRIENICKNSGKNFESDYEKIAYAAKCCPPVFSKGTKFEQPTDKNGNQIFSNMHIVKDDENSEN